MSNQFFIWKDAKCNGKDPVWIELSGDDFLKFIQQPENSQRKFVKEYFDEDNKALGFYKFEVTDEQFRRWDAKRKQKERSEDVLIANNKKQRLLNKDDVNKEGVNAIPCVVSFDVPLTEDEETTYHDIVPDRESGYEKVEEKLMVKKLHQILGLLSDDEKELLNHLYFNNLEKKSENEIATKMTISHQLLGYRKKKILKKLKKFFAET